MRTDGNGLRIGSEGSPAQMNCPKICFIGDSNVFGHGVDGNQSIPANLHRLLRGAGYDVAVINAGVPGYSPGQEFIALRDHIIPRFDPALVIWGVHFNDTLDMRYRSLHFRMGDKLIRIPGWTNGIYLQGLIQKKAPEFLRGSLLLNLAASSLEYVDPVHWLERPSNAASAEKINMMVKEVEALGVPVLVLRMASLWELTDTDPVTVAFYSGFPKFFDRHLNLNDAVRERTGGGADMVERLVLTEDQDPLRHLSPYGNAVCAEAVFDYLSRNRMTAKFPMIKTGK